MVATLIFHLQGDGNSTHEITGKVDTGAVVSCTPTSMHGGGTPYNGLYGEAPPKRGTFFRLQVYERVGISQAEVYEREGKSVI